MQQERKRRRQRFFVGGFGGALAIIIAVVLVSTLTSGSSKPKKTASATTSTAVTTASTTASTPSTTAAPVAPPVSVPLIQAPAKPGCPKLNGTSPHYTHFSSAPPMCINPAKDYTANLVTDAGTITIKLLAAQNPVTVNNFVFLSLYHYYNGTAFHRVVTGFVDQGGDPTGTGEGGPGYSFNGGAPKSAKVYTAGAVAMANSTGPASDGSQFFIVVGHGGAGLTANYSYFGQVTAGMSVVNKINADGSAGEQGTPKVVHKILRVTITES